MSEQDIEQLKLNYLFARQRWSTAKGSLLAASALLDAARRARTSTDNELETALRTPHPIQSVNAYAKAVARLTAAEVEHATAVNEEQASAAEEKRMLDALTGVIDV